ncbi:hypothetical protein DHEL01_v210128 [Diaporthe helianthi]|uniref:Uncharacterized protein n=1 Tax=Diaporthe helianthi TaxID=158607 RepID=A0A2P5HMK4_DIAHE|nr:hypothetical protein DHEL01_v210128 [Diaporthe helianthi]
MNPTQLALLLGIAAVANSHGIMIEPRPYNLHTAPLQQVAPLGAELPFPCQGRTEHADYRTTLTAGTTQTVKFWVSAVHGGGSCQFSVTYDNPPPADPSQWKTIYTIIGDCPAKAVGNLPTTKVDQDGRENGPQCGNSDGEEWFNKIGNREMYMTCAPVSIVGGTDDKELMESLPPVFVANIPGQCTTGSSGHVFNIPNPGKFGIVNAEPSALGNGQGQCPAADLPSFVVASESPQGSGQDNTASSAASPTSTTSQSNHPSSFVTVTTSSRATTSDKPKYDNSTSSPPATGTATSEAPSTESGQPEWAAGMTRCPRPDGTIFCYEDNAFGLCNQGWAETMPLNENQVCINGEITYKYNFGA